MLIIGNNCCGAEIYKSVIKQQYNNPFIWCRTDIISLAKYWNNINFKNIDIFNENKLLGFWHILIDNKCDLRFRHHKFDPKAKIPIIIQPTDTQDAEIRYCKIWELLVNDYNKRLNRMDLNEKPIFVFYEDWQDGPEKLEELKKYTDRIIIIPKIKGCGVVKTVRLKADYIKKELEKFK